MVLRAKEMFETRIAQVGANISAAGDLTELAEELDVFGGPIDTVSTKLFGKRPASVPSNFRTIDAERLDARPKGSKPVPGDNE